MATTGNGTAFTYMDVGRDGMRSRHSVFKVHSIPPAAYFTSGKGFRQGDVCASGLWDEAVDEPVAYPFVAGSDGFCYLPNFKPPLVTNPAPAVVLPEPSSVEREGELRPDAPKSSLFQQNPQPACQLGCRWND